MFRYLLSVSLLAFVLLGGDAKAQQQVIPCVPTTTTDASGQVHYGCINVTSANPLPTTASGAGGGNQGTPNTAANAWPIYETIGGTAMSATNPMFVNPGTGATFPVSGTFWQTTQPVSVASLPLPSGAATAAKQPALGTAGTPSADVLSVQGAASMTPLKTDGSGVTQPVSLATAPALVASSATIGNVGQIYPAGSTPITATATGTTTATTATLAANASLHTWICGFSIRANATAAATGNSTVTGVVTATMNFTQWTAPNSSGLGVTEEVFTPCIESSAINTGVSVISAAPGTGGVVSVSAWGFQL